MPLTSRGNPDLDALPSHHFSMTVVGKKTAMGDAVLCRVNIDSALWDECVERATDQDTGQAYVARQPAAWEKHRSYIEDAASKKFDQGLREPRQDEQNIQYELTLMIDDIDWRKVAAGREV